MQLVKVVSGSYLDDQAQLELVVQHAVAACAAEGVRPDLVSNVQLVSAQGLEESHPHLRHSSPAGEVTEHAYVLTYEVAVDDAEVDCAHVELHMEQCALSEKVTHFAKQHAAGKLVRALAADSAEPAERGSSSLRRAHAEPWQLL
jgi:hypothetical protein